MMRAWLPIFMAVTLLAGCGTQDDDTRVQKLEIVQLPTLTFQASEFEINEGPVEITFVTRGGKGTLVIDGIEDFILTAPDGPSSATVTLDAGTYTIGSDIPGHRAAGLVATLIARPRRQSSD